MDVLLSGSLSCPAQPLFAHTAHVLPCAPLCCRSYVLMVVCWLQCWSCASLVVCRRFGDPNPIAVGLLVCAGRCTCTPCRHLSSTPVKISAPCSSQLSACSKAQCWHMLCCALLCFVVVPQHRCAAPTCTSFCVEVRCFALLVQVRCFALLVHCACAAICCTASCCAALSVCLQLRRSEHLV